MIRNLILIIAFSVFSISCSTTEDATLDPSEKIYTTKEVDQKPRAARFYPPQYPAKLENKSIDGKVRVKYVVTSTGFATNIGIIESSHDEFSKAAIIYISRMKFKPATIDGKKVSCQVSQLIAWHSNK